MGRGDVALLRAALLDGDAAIAAFREWRALYDFEGQHEDGRFLMLPLLHANMSRLGLDDPVMARLRGVHLHSWAKGQRRYYSAARIIASLQGEGIPVMMTKSIALAQGYYPSPALRPLHDIDVLVPRERAIDALQLLGRAGWRHESGELAAGGNSALVFMLRRPGVNLRRPGDDDVDLHWSPLHEVIPPFLAEWFWNGAESVSLDGVSALRPLPGPLLFHVVSHGLRPSAVVPLRWVADALMVLDSAGPRIDWPAFWSMARRARLERRLSEGLEQLALITGRELEDAAAHRPRTSLVETMEVAAFNRSRGGQFSGTARRMLFIANVLRLLGSVQPGSVPTVAAQWLRDKASPRST